MLPHLRDTPAGGVMFLATGAVLTIWVSCWAAARFSSLAHRVICVHFVIARRPSDVRICDRIGQGEGLSDYEPALSEYAGRLHALRDAVRHDPGVKGSSPQIPL
jgi:hypothetical protein